MLKKLVTALALVGLASVGAGAAESPLQPIADALDVSTTKTFQFTGNGTMFPARSEHQPGCGLAEAIREKFDAVLRFHRRCDAR